ncbi:MAG: recombinase family protein [Steroidobacteraceae bacterium]
MLTDFHQKVTVEHLRREAFVYVRQSTSRQILENTESTRRQYALRDRAVALGWPIERVHTVDDDQGLSAARAENRNGFQRLVSEVALVAPASCWDWKSHAWRATTPIGNGFWSYARTRGA